MLYMDRALESSRPIAPGEQREILCVSEPVQPGDDVALSVTLRPNPGEEADEWTLTLPSMS